MADIRKTVVYIRGRHGRAPPHPVPFFFMFMQFSGKNYQNNRLPPLGVGTPMWEILDPPLQTLMKNLESETESNKNLEILPPETRSLFCQT